MTPAQGGAMPDVRIIAVLAAATVALAACTTASTAGEPAPAASPNTGATTSASAPATVTAPVVTSAGTWTDTPDPPIEPRYDALALSAGGSYYVLGGLDGRMNRPLLDGARYDPASDTWTRIAGFGEAPTLVTSHSSAALLEDRLYVISPRDLPLHGPDAWPADGDTYDGRDFAVLDLRTGTWTELPPPPRAGVPGRARLVAGAGGIFAFQEGSYADGRGEGDVAGKDYAYDVTAKRWTELPAAPLASGHGRYATQLDAAHVLVQTWHDDGEAVVADVAVLDLAAGSWGRPIAFGRYAEFVDESQGWAEPRPTVAGGSVVWTAELPGPDETSTRAVLSCPVADVVRSSIDSCALTVLEPAYTRELTVRTGGLAARFVSGDLVVPRARLATTTAVEAWYHLYEPGTQRLLAVPALPGVRYADSSTAGRYAAVLAAAGDSVLACWGSDEDPSVTRAIHWREDCHLLHVRP